MKIYMFNMNMAKNNSPILYSKIYNKQTSSLLFIIILIGLILITSGLYYYLPIKIFIFLIMMTIIMLFLYYKTSKNIKMSKQPSITFIEKNDNIYALEIKNNNNFKRNSSPYIKNFINDLLKEESIFEKITKNPKNYPTINIYNISNTSNIKEYSDYYQMDCIMLNLKTSRLKGNRIYIGKCYNNYEELINKLKEK